MSGIAFSMVTLATAQVGSIIVLQDPGGLTGGEEGLAVDRDPSPTHSSGSSTRSTSTGWRWPTSSSSTWSSPGSPARGPGASGRRSARTSAGSRCSVCGPTASSCWSSCWRVSWPRWAASSTCCCSVAPRHG
ncbi:hypothetical protein U6N30_27290 [Blastococcus brunescens]|uniref:Secreted protein n=1 Tax=Blastococcus brunescens TaxID=1564165 RepID=A0ABZ1AY66_9ACTN|nr:hypothetical protein [Blastococcus sp. BMG 8361]WRL63404.1 hypothetical protein U6N30_27290 [Blastococcus sp. BMG 8361]